MWCIRDKDMHVSLSSVIQISYKIDWFMIMAKGSLAVTD